MNTRETLRLLGAAGIGAALMYELDPDRGRRRRALARDKLRSAARHERDFLGKGVRDLAHRVDGAVQRARHALAPSDAADRVVEGRVRTALGRALAHPGAIEVEVNEGIAILSGDVLEAEVEALRSTVRRVDGVAGIDDRLHRHLTGDGVMALPGAVRHPRRTRLGRENWPPAWRLAAGAAAGGAILCGLRARTSLEVGAGFAGGLLMLRVLANRPLAEVLGVTGRRRAEVIQKSIVIQAPVEDVYGFWTDLENFPRFMEHVRDVRRNRRDPGRSHWEVRGPGGISMMWEAELVAATPNELVAWKTLPGSSVQHAGIVRFERLAPDETRIQIEISFRPLGGRLGQAVASLFGLGPRSTLDDDLVRFKGLLERGRTHVHGRAVTRDEIKGAGS